MAESANCIDTIYHRIDKPYPGVSDVEQYFIDPRKTHLDLLLERAIKAAAFRTVDNEAHKEFFDTYVPALEEQIKSAEGITEEQQTTIIKLIMVARTDEFTSLMLDNIVKGSEEYGNRMHS